MPSEAPLHSTCLSFYHYFVIKVNTTPTLRSVDIKEATLLAVEKLTVGEIADEAGWNRCEAGGKRIVLMANLLRSHRHYNVVGKQKKNV